ncbi:alpha/beta fold hydrolase [Blattabacterium cuenoti]|uniref:alpha/beta fold hydrolase n=1 Tax=Blattabacterium cuenoti TaxID=1653831 RepID=UPI00163C39C4|nr:alpha/beta fold hydrolase [Blattabacterium cuenoti]
MILYSQVFGQGDPPIIILHGLFGNGRNWMSFSQKISKYYQIHLVDIRNHGNSFCSTTMNYECISKDILYYINHYNLKNPIIIGHSMGGKAAIKFSLNYPLIPKKIIIVDICPKNYYNDDNYNILQALNSVNFNVIQTRKDLDIFLSSSIKNIKIRSFFLKSTNIKSNGKLSFSFFLYGISKNYHFLQEKITGGIYKNPTLFMRGEYSEYILYQDYSLIKKMFPNSYIITINNSKHWIHIDNPIDFYQKVYDFIKN